MSCSQMDRLMQSLTVEVPGATQDLINLQLFNVVDEFLRRTSAWRWYEGIDLNADQQDYAFTAPNDTAIVRVLGVNHNGLPLRPAAPASGVAGITQSSLGALVPELTFPDGDASFLPAQSDLDSSGLFSYAIYRPNYITFTMPIDEETMKFPVDVALALSLSRGCLECDCGDWPLEEWMFDTFFDNWLDGTLARLQGMVAKPWTNVVMAAYHGKRFRNAMAFRKQEALRGYTYGVPSWRFPRGGWV